MDSDYMMLCPIKIFTGLKPSALLAQISTLRRFQNLQVLKFKKRRQVFDQKSVHAALMQMNKDISAHKLQRRTQIQMRHITKSNVLRINIEVSNYLMVRSHNKRPHKS